MRVLPAAFIGAIVSCAVIGCGTALAMTGTSTPQAAVTAAVLSNGPCFQINFSASAKCPITPRMHSRVKALVRYNNLHFHTGPANFFCRCQGGKTTIVSAAIAKNGRATVLTSMGATNHLTFVLVKSKSGWLIDDQYCTKSHAADFYKENVPTICK